MVLILSVRETFLWIGQQGEQREMDYSLIKKSTKEVNLGWITKDKQNANS